MRIDNLKADLILGFSFDGSYVVAGCEEGKAESMVCCPKQMQFADALSD
jgi:hypothetical protein